MHDLTRTPLFHNVPGLATVTITSGNHVKIVLDPTLDGTADFASPDVDDFLRNWSPGASFYDSTDTSDESLRRLRVFMETLYQWDHDNDGAYDADLVVADLMKALPKEATQILVFCRPRSTGLMRFCSAIMPPAPERHIVYSFGHLKPRYRWWHYATAVPMIALFIGSLELQRHFASWLMYSPLTATIKAADVYGPAVYAIFVSALIVNSRLGKQPTMGFSPHTFGFFSRAAINEEQTFREGAENWTIWQRIRSCLSFGLVHQGNMVYPLATILPLAVCGGVFMATYLRVLRKTNNRRIAVLAASVQHRVYNRIALFLLAGYLISLAWTEFSPVVLGLVGIVAAWGSMAITSRRKRS